MILQRTKSSVSGWFFFALIAAYCLQSIFLGLRWGYQWTNIIVLQLVLAPIIPVLVWLSFGGAAAYSGKRNWFHLLPILFVWFLVAIGSELLDLAIICVFLLYGMALLRLAGRGPDGLPEARLEGAVWSHRALVITALAMIGSAFTDVAIIIDFIRTGGENSGILVTAAQTIALLLIGVAAEIANTNAAASNQESRISAIKVSDAPTLTDIEIAAAADKLLKGEMAYKDLELNLRKIARRLKLPERAVSIAINRQHGMSVSQYVNQLRIDEACQLLSKSKSPVIEIALDSGFLTKSNFNREFLRLKKMTPSQWRSSNSR